MAPLAWAAGRTPAQVELAGSRMQQRCRPGPGPERCPAHEAAWWPPGPAGGRGGGQGSPGSQGSRDAQSALGCKSHPTRLQAPGFSGPGGHRPCAGGCRAGSEPHGLKGSWGTWGWGRGLMLSCPHQLAKQYGPVFTVHLGHQKMVVLTGYEAVREALVGTRQELAGRPPIAIFQLIQGGGGRCAARGGAEASSASGAHRARRLRRRALAWGSRQGRAQCGPVGASGCPCGRVGAHRTRAHRRGPGQPGPAPGEQPWGRE